MTENDSGNINPQITDVTIGVRNLRKIKIYPLSAHDEFEVSRLFIETISKFFTGRKQDASNFEFIDFFIGFVKSNISKVISLVSDEDGEEVLKELTNSQVVEIAKIVVHTNYEEPLKNAQSLLDLFKEYLSGRLSPTFVSDTEDIDLTTASTKAFDRED